jgi:2-polyprenyl-3-methyl-5-hydroxy-6-metoxy-1,4-benzoquinol methylase
VNNKCKICGSENLNRITGGEINLIQCNDCDVHYLAGFGEKIKIDNYYKKDYIITSGNIVETEFRRLFRATEQIELTAEIMKYKEPPATLLDIGCDKGFFIDQARRFGFDCTGIELSEKALDYTDKTGLNVVQGIGSLNTKYDIAVMWHSLEHFPEPLDFMQQLKVHLKDDAYLFIRVPAFDSWSRKIFGKKWIWFQPQNHFFHYSTKSINKLLELAGYSVEKIEHRKPNNRFSKKLFCMSKSLFNIHFSYKLNLREILKRKYEDFTGIELFVVAKLKR